MREDKSFQTVSAPQVLVQDQPWNDDNDILKLNLRAMFARIWRGKWILILSILAFGFFGYIASSGYDPRYRANAMVMFDVEGTESADVETILSGTQVTDTNLQNQIEVLRSKNLVEKVVEQLALHQDPEFNPRLTPSERTYRSILSEWVVLPNWATELAQNYGLMAPPDAAQPAPDPEEQIMLERRIVVGNVLAKLELSPVPSSRVIEIAFSANDPNTSAAIVNSIAEQYIVDQLEAKLEATRAASEWLAERVQQLRERTERAEQAVSIARTQRVEDGGQSLDITNRQLDALSASLAIARTETRTAKSIYERLNDAARDPANLGSVYEFRTSEQIAELLTAEADLLEQKEAAQRATVSPVQHLLRLDIQIEGVQSRMAEQALRIAESARINWEDKKARELALESEVRSLEILAREQAENESYIRTLERDEQASRLLYESLMKRLEETSQEEELTAADARILSAADPPLSPERQAQKRTQVISLVLGAAFGIGLIFLLEKLNRTFRTVSEVEQITGETVLGSIPSAGHRRRRSTVIELFKNRPRSGLAEAVRNLRTSILFSNTGVTPRVVMFTSSIPQEGKSTTAMLVALTSRQMGKSAIVVDCDLRRPVVAEMVGVNDTRPGILSAVNGDTPLNDCIYSDAASGVDVLVARAQDPESAMNAADILSSQQFRTLIKTLRDRYDLVVLDTPPTLVVADAKIVAAHADSIVYVVRWARTRRAMVVDGLRELTRVRSKIVGVALTAVNERKAARASYSKEGYYREEYKYYYSA